MKATDVVRKIMKTKGVKVAALADKLGLKRSNVVSERLSQSNISVAKLDEMLRLLGYKIMIMPDETPEEEGWYRAE
ncbi:MAG: hypothetical protein ACOYJX_02140 [Acutalibacteraceae bacterium]|jgi:transcriptional regulator with XRE-family HTH domain